MNDRDLPAGKTCKDCFHLCLCESLGRAAPADIWCWHNPSRFVDLSTVPKASLGDGEAHVVAKSSDTPRTDAMVLSAQKAGQALLDHIKQLERENARLQKQIQIMRSSQHEFCPDCRDKVKSEPCLRCQAQAARVAALKEGLTVGQLKEENARLREQLEAAREDRCVYESEAKRLREGLEHIVEYWNRDQNETAMADALWHIIETAEEALKGGAK